MLKVRITGCIKINRVITLGGVSKFEEIMFNNMSKEDSDELIEDALYKQCDDYPYNWKVEEYDK